MCQISKVRYFFWCVYELSEVSLAEGTICKNTKLWNDFFIHNILLNFQTSKYLSFFTIHFILFFISIILFSDKKKSKLYTLRITIITLGTIDLFLLFIYICVHIRTSNEENEYQVQHVGLIINRDHLYESMNVV